MTWLLTFLHGNAWGIAAGLLIAWWFLPQPAFMRRLYEWFGALVRGRL